MCEQEIQRLSDYFKLPIGILSYTEDNIIQMTNADKTKIVGFSSIVNFMHNQIEKENIDEDFYLTKQFFDYANVFIRSTSKRDKCNTIIK